MASEDERLRDAEVRLARLEERQSADLTARTIAKEEIDRRLTSMNALREQFLAERGQFLTVAAYEARHNAVMSMYEERHDAVVADMLAVRNELKEIQARDRATRRAVATMLAAATVLFSAVFVFVEIIK